MKTMGGWPQVSRLSAALLPVACGLFLTAAPGNTGAAEAWRSRVSAKLQSVYDARGQGGTTANMARFDEQGRVETDVHYNCSSVAPTAALAAAGLSTSGAARLSPLCVIEGWIVPAAVPKLALVSGVTRVKLPSYARHIPRPSLKSTAASPAAGTIDGNALTIMRADQFVAQAGGGGGGVIV